MISRSFLTIVNSSMNDSGGEASQILLQGSYEELLADDESIYAFKTKM